MQFVPRRSLRSLLLAVPFAAACGAQPDPSAATDQALSGTTRDAACKVDAVSLFYNDFRNGLAGWTPLTSNPDSPGNDWAPVITADGHEYITSDPGGETMAGYFNQITSPTFSGKGLHNIRMHVRTRFQVQPGAYKILVGGAMNPPTEVAEYADMNPSWPGFDDYWVPLPEWVSGESAAYVQVVMNDPADGDYGADIDTIEVQADANSSDVVFADDFRFGLRRHWDPIQSTIPGPDHIYRAVRSDICPGHFEARSDPAGMTVGNNSIIQMWSRPFSLVGKTSAQIILKVRYSLPHGDFAVYMSNASTHNTNLVFERNFGSNPSFPLPDTYVIDIPAMYLGLPDAIVRWGDINFQGGDFGSAIEYVKVVAH